MKRFLLALCLYLIPAVAFAQCNGVFPAHTFCGNNTGSPAIPSPVPQSAVVGPGSSTPQDIVTFQDSAGLQLKDSGVPITALTNSLIATTGRTITTGTTLATTDCGTMVQAGTGSTGLFTVTLPSPSGFTEGCTLGVYNADVTALAGKALSGFPSAFSSQNILWPGQILSVRVTNGTWTNLIFPGLWQLTTTTDFYVRPDGNDANDGLANSSSRAWLTANHGLNVIADQIDINSAVGGAANLNHTCASPPCTITASTQLVNLVNGIVFTGGVPTYKGDCTTPTNVILAPTPTAVQADIQVTYAPTNLNVCGFSLRGGANVNFGFYVSGGATVRVTGPMDYGLINGGSQNAHMVVASSGRVYILSNYTISGNSTAHFFPFHQGQLEFANSLTITCTGATAFTDFAVVTTLAQVTHQAATFSGCGSVTGQRYLVSINGVIDTNGGGANYFPGSTTGTAITGGQYN